MYVEVDGQSTGAFLSYEYEFKSNSFALQPGFHTVRFVYSKDSLYKRGQDKAFIAVVDVHGSSAYDDVCQPCKPGWNSTDGSFKCSPCPADTYAASFSSATCTPCPPDQYSHAGSSACMPRPSCTSADFSVLYGECQVLILKRTIRVNICFETTFRSLTALHPARALTPTWRLMFAAVALSCPRPQACPAPAATAVTRGVRAACVCRARRAGRLLVVTISAGEIWIVMRDCARAAAPASLFQVSRELCVTPTSLPTMQALPRRFDGAGHSLHLSQLHALRHGRHGVLPLPILAMKYCNTLFHVHLLVRLWHLPFWRLAVAW